MLFDKKWNELTHGVGSEVLLSLCVVVPFSHKGNVTSAIIHAIWTTLDPPKDVFLLCDTTFLLIERHFVFVSFYPKSDNSRMCHCVCV